MEDMFDRIGGRRAGDRCVLPAEISDFCSDVTINHHVLALPIVVIAQAEQQV